MIWTCLSSSMAMADNFETNIGAYHVKLENGSASADANNVNLTGTVSIAAAGVGKLTVRNGRVALIGSIANIPPRVGNTLTDKRPGVDHPGVVVPLTTVPLPLPTIAPNKKYTSLKGTGDIELSDGTLTLTIPACSLELGNNGAIILSGGDTSIKGCSHEVKQGSLFNRAGLTLKGSLKCGNNRTANSVLKVRNGQISGSGNLQLYHHLFNLDYAASGQSLSATGRWNGTSPDWRILPNSGDKVEFKVTNPSMTLRMQGTGVSATLDADKVEVRTRDKNQQGQPFAKAEINPDPMTISGDFVPLTIPQLTVNDLQKAAREACENTVRATAPPDNRFTQTNEHNNFINNGIAACGTRFPAPPSIPHLPGSVSVKVEVVIR
ncbi:MAG: hypothetical protein ACYC69_11865 [Thermodesulfovibrionales bacterium]